MRLRSETIKSQTDRRKKKLFSNATAVNFRRNALVSPENRWPNGADTKGKAH